MNRSSWQNRSYGWLSTARYPQPLDVTTSRKWQAMVDDLNMPIYIIGFSVDMRPRQFSESAHFYLLPKLPSAILRYLTFFMLAPLLLIWLVLRHDVSVLVAQSPYEGAVGAFIKQFFRLFRRRIFLIIESHNDFEAVLFLQRESIFANVYRRVMGAFAHYAFRHANALRSISQATENQMKEFAPDVPVIRFMAWTDSEVFRQAQRQQPINENYTIVYAGVLVPGKGVHHLIDAFAQLEHPQAKLYLVGRPANPEYVTNLKEQGAERGIEQQIQFVGEVSQAEVANYMANARVFVLPSLSEGLGRVVVEAMLCGTPVVASRVGGLPEIIQDGENGLLVPPDDVDALANALKHLMTSDEITLMSEKARVFAEGFFSTESYVEGYRHLFELVDGMQNADQ